MNERAMAGLMTTPVTIQSLDGDAVIFEGTAEETVERSTMFGSMETVGHFPKLMLQRDVWEALGSPVSIMLSLNRVAE